jgi:hypothetical protein
MLSGIPMLDANITFSGRKNSIFTGVFFMENQRKKLRLDEVKVESFVTSDALNAQTIQGGTYFDTRCCEGTGYIPFIDGGGAGSGNCNGYGDGNATCGGYTCPGGNGPNCPYGPPSPTCGGPPLCLPASQRPGDICV